MQGLGKDERPDVISYNIVIRAYGNNMNKAEELIQDMIANGLKPTEHTYDTLLHVLRRDSKVKNKDEKLSEIRERYFPTSSKYPSSNRNKKNVRAGNNNRRHSKKG